MQPERNIENFQNSPSPETFQLTTGIGTDCVGVHIRPEKPTSAITYAIGWGTDTSMHMHTMGDFVNFGYDVWSVNPPREGSLQQITEHNIAEVEVNKAAAVVALLQKMKDEGIEETDIVAHSEGAIYATLAALLTAQSNSCAKIRSLILVEPAGCKKNDNVIALTSRFAKQAAQNILRDPGLYLQNRNSNKSMLSPVASITEAIAIATTRLPELLQKLHKKTGVKIGVIGGRKDGVFPAMLLQKTFQELDIPILYKDLDIYHNGIYTNSQEITTEVHQMIKELNNESH